MGAIMKIDRKQIMEIIPHRDPMLLIDEVSEIYPGKRIVAKYYIDPKLEIFKGHFPQAPVLPGVYATEIMAQASDILLLSMERYANTIPYFIGINNVRFMKKILPGDTITVHSKITEEHIEKGIVTCTAEIHYKGEIACKGEVTLAMR